MEKIAICSAKGGVGKTTITYSLAMKYHKAGKKIGLFDADVYGPNLINLFAYANPNQSAHNSKITPAKLPYSIDGICLLYTSPSPRDLSTSRMPSSA